VLADLHSHTTLSDGSLSFEELVSAAERNDYDVLAITDHVDPTTDHREVAVTVRAEVDRLSPDTSVRLLAGVEITDFEPAVMDRIAREVRGAGAQMVVAHGECLMLDVYSGTNAAAVRSRNIDILAHPGLLTRADAFMAARNGVFLELSALVHASYANGHVFHVAQQAGAPIVVNSDAHARDHLLTPRKVAAVIVGAGGTTADVQRVVDQAPSALARHALKALAAVS
jgi:histidinol phosphatase-like PHP family hydrolase